MSSDVESLIQTWPEDRQEALTALVEAARRCLPPGFAEHACSRMVHFSVPHSLYPDGYHCNPKQPLPFVSIASTKGHMALHHMGLYADANLLVFFQDRWEAESCGKLNMGKGCVRFTSPKRLMAALPVLEALLGAMKAEEWISTYTSNIKR